MFELQKFKISTFSSFTSKKIFNFQNLNILCYKYYTNMLKFKNCKSLYWTKPFFSIIIYSFIFFILISLIFCSLNSRKSELIFTKIFKFFQNSIYHNLTRKLWTNSNIDIIEYWFIKIIEISKISLEIFSIFNINKCIHICSMFMYF